MTQLGQDLGEKSMRQEGRLKPTESAMAEKQSSTRKSGAEDIKVGLGVPSGGEEIHMGRAPEAEKKPCELPVERPLCENRTVLAGSRLVMTFSPECNSPARRTTGRKPAGKRRFNSLLRGMECVTPSLPPPLL